MTGPDPERDPVVEPESNSPVPLEQAEAVVRGFLEALGRGDVDAMMSRCAVPFYLDKEALDTEDALRAELTTAAKKMGDRGGIEIVGLTAISDWRAFANDYKGPETDLTAFVARARIEGLGEEALRFFVRMGDDPKIVSIKD